MGLILGPNRDDDTHMPRALCFTPALITAALVAAGEADAQSTPSTPGQQSTGNGIGIRSIDAGIEDVGPLGQSLQLQPIDMRESTNFSRVYGLNDGSGRFVRRDGAINAVFNRSDYTAVRTRGGAVVVPLVPAGTIFYIGDPVSTGTLASAPSATVGLSDSLSDGPLGVPQGATSLSRLSNRIVWSPGADEANTRFAPLAATDATPGQDTAAMTPAPTPTPASAPASAPTSATTVLRRPIPSDLMVNEPYRRTRLKELTRRVVLGLIEDGRTIVPDASPRGPRGGSERAPSQISDELLDQLSDELGDALELDG